MRPIGQDARPVRLKADTTRVRTREDRTVNAQVRLKADTTYAGTG